MQWSNLPKNKCPQCGKDFMLDLTTLPVPGKGQLLAHGCGFKIYERRYQAIVSGMTLSKLEEEQIRKEVNNLESEES